MGRDVHATLFRMTKEDILALLERECGVSVTDCDTLTLVVETDRYVLVPEPVFRLENLDDYFLFQNEKRGDELIVFNRIPLWKAVNVFTMPVALYEALAEFIPEQAPLHQLTHLLEGQPDRMADRISVWVRPQVVDVAVVKDRRLQLANSFSHQSAADVAYFVLSCVEQFALSADRTVVELYQRDRSPEYRETLELYLKQCEVKMQ